MIKEEVKQQLEEKILPFWMSLRDDVNGGYYGLVDSDLHIYKEFTKGVILHSRILWFFSNAYKIFKKEEYLSEAKHAFQYIKQNCIDGVYGGVFWSTKYNGEALDTTKHTYNIAFTIYALSSYYDITKDKEVLILVMGLYHDIEKKCRDEYGYLESFSREFILEDNTKLSENGVIASRTMNTLLHVLEAYTELYRVTKNTEVKENLYWILDELKEKVYNEKLERLDVFFNDNMEPLIDLHSYGHDIEASWLIDRACEVLDDSDYTSKMHLVSDNLVANVYKKAFHKNSLWNECEAGVPDKTRVWWVQAEAIVGFTNAYQKDTSKVLYKEAAIAIWNYIKTYMIDPREGSEWFSEVDDNGEVTKVILNEKDIESLSIALGELHDKKVVKPIVETWKCPYHNGRMCMELINRSIEI